MNRDSVPNARRAELEQRIADLRARLPKHSVPPAMMQELEDLEEELASLAREEGVEDAAGRP